MFRKLEIPTLKVLLKTLCPVTHRILSYQPLSNTAKKQQIEQELSCKDIFFLLENFENEALFKD